MVHLHELPEDVLFVILGCLGPEDLLSIQQVCRGMHALGGADHVWRALHFDVPLDLPSSTSSHPAHLIKQSAVRALRLDQNWRKKEPAIKRLTHIPHTDIVDQLQFVGHEYIVGLSTAGNLATYVSLWHTGASVTRVARIEVPNVGKFAASQQDGCVVVAVTMSDTVSKSSLRIFILSLTGDVTEFRELLRHPLADADQVFFEVHLSGRIAAAGVAAFRGSIQYSLLLVNLDTHASHLIDMPCENMRSVRFKLYDDVIVMTAVTNSLRAKLLISCFELQALLSGAPPEPMVVHEVGGSWTATFDYYLTTEPTIHRSTRSFPLAVQHPTSAGTSTVIVYRVPLTVGPPVKQDYTFNMIRDSSIEILCLGETGKRVVWLERGWDEIEFRFRKAVPPRFGGARDVEPLWPAHVGLPFEPHMCHAMYFEEATGRICFSLNTEDVYIMEF